MLVRKTLLFLLLISSVFSIKALNIDSLQVSLLTVMPRPNEVYTVYGHSALRLHSPAEGFDAVYNWGTFNFDNSSRFIFQFIKGETDYYLSQDQYSRFVAYYAFTNSTIEEQVLNLTEQEKEMLIKKLITNLQPENIVYRYNFLFDNCTTRIRDLIEEVVDNRIIYPEQAKETTFRHLIHSCTEPYPWMTFGIDLLIGSGADSLISLREEMFLPEKLMKYLADSYVVDNIDNETVERSVISKQYEVIRAKDKDKYSLFLFESPLYTGWILFFILIVLSWKWNNKIAVKGLFSLLFLIAGIAGSIIAFLILFSEHPCVSPNWNIVWLHPFHFIGFAGYFFKKSYRVISLFHCVNLLLLCFLLISWYWIPQSLNIADTPYIACLGKASVDWLVNKKKNKNE